MSPFPSIVCGVDYSDASAAALFEAYRVASMLNSHLTVAHVVSEDELSETMRVTGLDQEAILTGRRLRLDRFCLDTMEDRAVPSLELDVLVGYPFAMLTQLVEKQRASLLVLGSRGKSTPWTHTLGSVALRCVNSAPTEVLVVRKAHDSGFKRVVAAVDFSDASHRAVKQAATFAKANGADLHVVHVFAPAWKQFGFEVGQARVDEEQVKSYLNDMHHQAAGFVCEGLDDFGGLSATIEVREHFSIGGGLVEYLTEVDADLVVLGTQAHAPNEVKMLGSTAEYVVHDAPCSVLTVQPEGEIFHSLLSASDDTLPIS